MAKKRATRKTKTQNRPTAWAVLGIIVGLIVGVGIMYFWQGVNDEKIAAPTALKAPAKKHPKKTTQPIAKQDSHNNQPPIALNIPLPSNTAEKPVTQQTQSVPPPKLPTPDHTNTKKPSLASQINTWLTAYPLDWLPGEDPSYIELIPTAKTKRLWPKALQALPGKITQEHPTANILVQQGDTQFTIIPPATGWLMLMIDDVGFKTKPIETMLSWSIPMIFAVLPDQPQSLFLAKKVAAAGLPVFLHQPMEPHGYPKVNPGQGALLEQEDKNSWLTHLEANFNAVPGVVGINNHMGSRFTENAKAMAVVMQWLATHHLMFIDSLTSEKSVAMSLCQQYHQRCLARDVFLDHEQTDTFVNQQIRLWLRKAQKNGFALAIGHPYDVTVARIGAHLKSIQEQGYRFIPFSLLVRYAKYQNEMSTGLKQNKK